MPQCTEPNLGVLIHAYELRCIADDDLERFELHLLKCDHCFREVTALQQQTYAMRRHPAIIELAGQVSDPQRPAWWRRVWRMLWPDTLLILRPGVAVALILLLIYPAWLGLRPSSSPSVSKLDSVWLLPTRSTAIKIKIDRDIVLSFVVEDAEPGKNYILEMTDNSGALLYRDPAFDGFDDYQTGHLLIKANSFKPGRIQFLIKDPIQDSLSYLEVYNLIATR